jgi:hypothetical protein
MRFFNRASLKFHSEHLKFANKYQHLNYIYFSQNKTLEQNERD